MSLGGLYPEEVEQVLDNLANLPETPQTGPTMSEKLIPFNAKTFSGKKQDLFRASQLEGSEIGDFWDHLVMLGHSLADMASPDFRRAWEEEIRFQHSLLQRDCRVKIVETQVTRQVETLEWVREQS